MASQLQQVLRSFCFNMGWKYAVFWKIKHRSRIMFACEDAYYDSNQYTYKSLLKETSCSLSNGPHSHDPLELAVAKMSYQVYSLGEGIVGQVAVSGKHSWIFSDQHVADSSSTSVYTDGWQNQFSAGIKTIAVVAVIPHGVLQLGSLHKITEDLKLVDHIRIVFSELQNSLAGCIHSAIHTNKEKSTCARNSDSAGFHDCLAKSKGSFHEDEVNLWSQLLSPLGKSSIHSYISPPPEGFSNGNIAMKVHERADCSMPGNEVSFPSTSENNLPTRLLQEEMGAIDNTKYGAGTNDFKSLTKRLDMASMPSVKNVGTGNSNLYNATVDTDVSQMVTSDLPVEILDPGEFHVPELPNMPWHQDIGNLELPIKSNHVETQTSAFNFCAGYELFEALGPSFHWGAEKNDSDTAIENLEGMESSSLLVDNSDMNLLDAVVAKLSYKGNDTESEKSCHETVISHLTADKVPSTSVCTMSSAGYSFDRDTSSSMNSVTYLKCFSSASSSRGSEQVERTREGVKVNKKRARPGESCRPRPRDRQLIQDRIKELRELVPNGSKCSIDSLLERTIKHMLFLHSITKHAEKLQKCSASKLLDKDTGMQRLSSREQGSSWAVEVGNDQKVWPIIVENINMNGQMLVEMLSEECGQFLDVAETIRSLSLTILKGVSEAHGKKTWMCFVVEGQNNRSMHRVDVLWSLMQLLQPKLTN